MTKYDSMGELSTLSNVQTNLYYFEMVIRERPLDFQGGGGCCGIGVAGITSLYTAGFWPFQFLQE